MRDIALALLTKIMPIAIGNTKTGFVYRLILIALISGSIILNPKEVFDDFIKNQTSYQQIKQKLEASRIQTNIWYGQWPPENIYA